MEALQGSSHFTITSQSVVGDVTTNLMPPQNALILRLENDQRRFGRWSDAKDCKAAQGTV